MYIKFILLGIFALGCVKENINSKKTSEQLLTQKSWKLVSHGYDHNNNKLVDIAEENIQECEKDNTYSFYLSRSGLFEDNSLSCGNGISDHPFNWQLTHGEKVLDFIVGTLNIFKLDEEEMILYGDEIDVNGQTTRYITIYRH